jgi:epsilon-lactone hydrolase
MATIHFSGRLRYRVRNLAVLCRAAFFAGCRRVSKGPRLPGWNWFVEVSTQVLKSELAVAFSMRDISRAREYLDSVVLDLPPLSKVNVIPVLQDDIHGSWFVPREREPQITLLYLHGGGYSFYPKTHRNLIALVTLAAKSRTFALDYRLSPDHRFPAQLEDAVKAYQWLLGTGTDPNKLVVAGDSAGGNLTLALLLTLRDSGVPLPALGIVLSPATDFTDRRPSLESNEEYDWVDRRMLLEWADWFCDPGEQRNPLVSPIYADLRGLPPIYIQAGGAELLYDSIKAFADCAARQGAGVVLETWPEMNHDFQMFGHCAPQSRQALARIAEVIQSVCYCRGQFQRDDSIR